MQNVIRYKEYIGSVHYSDTDKVFFGQIFGINDLVSFEGKSVDELRRSFIESVEDYIQTCKEIGKAPEKSFKGSFNVRVSPYLHKEASALATNYSITLNEFVKTALNYAVTNPQKIFEYKANS